MRGKAGGVRTDLPQFRDHPRLCGEKALLQEKNVRKSGSPPPMRGKGWQLHSRLPEQRITPAYAGKSPHTAARQRTCRDHPRLCGEKRSTTTTPCPLPGSPPPMRGKAKSYVLLGAIIRITPAYAGKSFTLFQIHEICKDHPRLCGEKPSCPTLPR